MVRTIVQAPAPLKKCSSPCTSPIWYLVGRVGRKNATTCPLASWSYLTIVVSQMSMGHGVERSPRCHESCCSVSSGR